MKLIKTLLFVSTLCMATPSFACPEDGHEGKSCKRHGPGQQLKEADTNKDGFVDKAEFQVLHDKHFSAMDINKDGKLGKDEIKAAGKENAMHERGNRSFNKADKNTDGKLDREEAKSHPRVSKSFDTIDVDKNGTVDRDEVHNFMKYMKEKHQH